MYILVRKNRVIDYCSDKYAYLGNMAICQSTGKAFEDATIVDIGNTPTPTDLLCQEYYYYQGSFVKARDNRKSLVWNHVLSQGEWSEQDKVYTVTHAGITANNVIEMIPSPDTTPDQLEALQNAKIIGGAQSYGALQLKALGEVPTVDIPVIFIFRYDV